MGRASLNLLSRADLHYIHDATLEILENPGLVIPSERALNILETAGASVNYEKNNVTIPSNIVEEALKKAPKNIKYSARNPKYDLLLEKKRNVLHYRRIWHFHKRFRNG
jgi:trimethylamine--corrinoid protein Co-methyltransferase